MRFRSILLSFFATVVGAAAASDDYLVIDLSGGTNASRFPVTLLSGVPAGGWSDDYKTEKLVMRKIPAGTFTQGSPSEELGRESDETARPVTLTKAFYIGVFEVTQRQWELVMGDRPGYFNNNAYYADRPVETVSYYDIRENPDNTPASTTWPDSVTVGTNSFFGRLRAKTGYATFDLPTEAQWEYACRAGTVTALNSGKDLTDPTNCPNMDDVGRYWYNGGNGYTQDGDTTTGTAAAGSYPPNAWGLYDMHGNLWEWCLDWYEPYSGTVIDPPGAASGLSRVLRGGSWSFDAWNCRSANRNFGLPDNRYTFYGFRAAASLFDTNVITVLPPSKIAPNSFVARWKWVQGAAPEGQISVVMETPGLPQFVPGFEACEVLNSAECRIPNLLAGRTYRYRIRRVMSDGGFSPWSSSMKVKTGTGMPVFKRLLSEAPVSKGIIQEFALTNLATGTGTLKVNASNTNAVKATVSAGVLKLQYLWRGTNTAKVTMTLTHPASGYKVSYGATLTQATGSVAKVGQSALIKAGTRVAQQVTFKNKTGGMIYGLRVRVKGLDNPAWLVNQTGRDPVTKAPILEIPCVLPAGSQTVVRLIYNNAYKAQAATRQVKYAAWAVMTPVHAMKPVSGEMIMARQDLYDGLWLLSLPANRNRLYTITHSDDGGATWTLDLPVIRSTANYLMWLDTDDGAPEDRLYRVVDVGI